MSFFLFRFFFLLIHNNFYYYEFFVSTGNSVLIMQAKVCLLENPSCQIQVEPKCSSIWLWKFLHSTFEFCFERSLSKFVPYIFEYSVLTSPNKDETAVYGSLWFFIFDGHLANVLNLQKEPGDQFREFFAIRFSTLLNV